MPNSSTVSSRRRMLAAVLVGPARLEVREVPLPACPDDGLRLRVYACGICGSDIRAFRGHKAISGVHKLGDEVLAGHVVGHEIAGVVDAVGPEVTGFCPSDRVTVAPSLTCGSCDACRRGESVVCRSYGALGWSLPGGFAEYVAVPGRLLTDGSVNRIPDQLPAWRASLTEPLACAVHAQAALQVGKGDLVLVSGGGPMGSLNLLLARQRGATLVAMTDPNECRRDFARSLGAEVAVDPKAPDAAAALLDGTRGQGFSAVILAVSSIGPIRELFRLSPAGRYPLLAPGSRVNVFSGLDPGDTSFSLDARAFFYQGIRLIASVNSAPSHNAEALRLIATGAVDVGPLVTARLPLSQAPEAIALAMSRPRVNQKVVLEPSPE